MGRDFRRLIWVTEAAGWTFKTIAPTVTKSVLPDSHITHASGKRKTVCASTVVNFFDVDPVRFNVCATTDDVARILNRHGMSVRDAAGRLGLSGKLGKRDPRSPTGWTYETKVPQAKAAIKRYAASKKGVLAYYLVRVCNKTGGDGHVIVLDSRAANRVDTDPRLRDARYVSHIMIVRPGPKLQQEIEAKKEAEAEERAPQRILQKSHSRAGGGSDGATADDWKRAQKAAQERVARGDWTAHVDLADGSLARSMSRREGR